jgi:hypothetical protein
MQKYQVKDWPRWFESAKSRTFKKCTHAYLPNKQDGISFTYIMSLADGASVYGIWHLIVGALSRQLLPRNGWMTSDGTESGKPWTVEEMALQWRRQEKEISRALQVLTSDRVGWIVDRQGYHKDTTVSQSDTIGSSDLDLDLDSDLDSLLSGKPDEYPPAFMELWHAFPRVAKDRSSKKKSFAAWKKIPAGKRTVLVKALDAWKRSQEWVKESGKYIPGAHRWIGEGKWEDRPAPAEGSEGEFAFTPVTEAEADEWVA